MGFWDSLGTFAITAVAFALVDIVWLGVVANRLYRRFLGGMLADPARWRAAVLFYALFVVGLVHFAVLPGVDAHSWTHALREGALYGLFTYATFDLTCRAVLREFPLGIVPVDMAWGTVLAGSVAAVSTAAYQAVT
jgi:uncharacterized membrane protein